MDRMDEHYLNAVPVTVSKMKEIIKSLYKSPEARKRTIALIGESGIGKNTIINEAAKELGIKELWFPAKGILPEDIRGIPMVEEVEGEKRYVFKMLDYIKPAFDPAFKGIVHIDEFAQAPKDVQTMLYMLLYDRRIDNNYLSDGAMVICSMNPVQESEYMLSRIQKAAQERLSYFKLTSSVSEWVEWAEKNKVDFRVISFVSENPDVMKKNSGRRFHLLSDLMKGIDETDHVVLRAIAQSAIDIDSASRFTTYIEELNEVNAVRLLKGDQAEFEKLENRTAGSKLYTRLQISATHALREDNIKSVFGITGSNKDKVLESIATNLVRCLDILAQDGLEIVVSFLKTLLKNSIPTEFHDVLDQKLEENDKLREALKQVLDPGFATDDDTI